MKKLFEQDLKVVNVGLQGFAANITAAGGQATNITWAPPAGADPALGWTLATLVGDPRVEAANRMAFERYLAAQPRLIDLVRAGEVIAGLGPGERRILHAGPPIAWPEMCGPQRGAIAGAILYEGWADDLDAAERLAASGEVALEPCHEHGAVGPMAGIISPSMPVWVVENMAAGNRAYSNLNEGLGKVLRFGANSPAVLDRLRWLGSEFFTTMQAGVRALADPDLKPLMAQALHMGDELHNRNAAASGLMFKRLTLALLDSGLPADVVRRALEFVAGNDHFFLNISMAASKSMSDAAVGVPGSSMVTVMARNGVNFGIKLSGTGDQWFQAPANPVDGLYFPGYSVDDAAADLGDSAITETNGLGGFAMAASPAIVQFVGGTPADATANSRRMLSITLGANPAFTLPPLNFGGTPAGIDARLVVDTGVLPIINTGIAHRQAGVGQIGAGITTAPMECFTAALSALASGLQT
ncbi:oxamate carbamoyltransferase subunit AllG family protein [Mycolicibacterium sp. Dal123E01]|uniref:oxamate carbamoyltransferase subunit AllG family protein n=1 Tax=Mycolicibacterium sp. Dal123E01 TaxID=3457578 RepID=UPI00403E96B8